MIFPDFKYNNYIIEFYGDLWHMNPKIVEAHTKHPFNKLEAAEIRKRDKIRENIIKRKGFKILIIWENDLKLNRNVELNKCISFLKEH